MTKELKCHFEICKELFNIKSKFENVDEEWYSKMAATHKYINFSPNGDFNFSLDNQSQPWFFPIEPDKQKMYTELTHTFKINNDRLSDLYFRFLVEEDLLDNDNEVITLEWKNSNTIKVTDGVNNLSPWLLGEIDYLEFILSFINPVGVKAEFDYVKSVIEGINPKQLLYTYLDARTGEVNIAELPKNVIQGFDSLENWLESR